MRVALIRRHFRVDGGAERALLNYINAYLAAGHTVTLLCESWRGSLDPRVQVVLLPTFGSRWMRNRAFRSSVMQTVKRQKFDFVQAHEWIPGANIVRLGDGLHSSWFRRLRAHRNFWAALPLTLSLFHRDRIVAERDTLMHRNLRRVIVNSKMVADELHEFYPRIHAAVKVQYTVVPGSFFREEPALSVPSKGVRLLFVGSGWERKGLETAIRVLAACRGDVSLAVIGQDKNQTKYIELARRLGVLPSVNFYGVVPTSESLYRQFDALILPTLYDPFPNVVAEALSSGIPVLTSSGCGGVDFQSDGSVLIADTLSEYCQHVNTLISDEMPVVDRAKYRELFSECRLMEDLEGLLQ